MRVLWKLQRPCGGLHDAKHSKEYIRVIMILYSVTKLKTNKIVYIGQTTQSISKRKGKHLSEARKGRGSILGAGIRKHGEHAFSWEVIAVCNNQNNLCRMEREYISKIQPQYNIQEGGKKNFIPWNKNRKEVRPEILKRISESASSRKASKRGKYSNSAVRNIREAKLKSVSKAFICNENGKIYFNKVEAAKDLGIKPGGISAVLSPKTRNKSINGYTFKYIHNF